MRVAAIDIGTNSIRLLKAEVIDGQLISGNKQLDMTRIGEGVNETGRLSEAGMKRSVDALVRFVGEAKAWDAEHTFALATSAVRDSENRDEFIKRVYEASGITIDVISGEEEAKLGFMGVLAGAGELEGQILVIDVGGGSTELIVGDAKGIQFVQSVNVGAVRMTGKHITTDPVSDVDYVNTQSDVALLTAEVVEVLKTYNITKTIGIGGTATTLGAMKLEMENYDRFAIQNSSVGIVDIRNMNQNLKDLSIEQRKSIKGLQPKRADIILAGSMVIETVLSALQIDELFISDYDNLEGCLVDRLLINA